MSTKMQPDKRRVSTAAADYGVAEITIWNYLRLGKLTRFKFGSVTLVSIAEIESLIAQGTAAAASEEAKQARIAQAARRRQVRVSNMPKTRAKIA